MDQDQRIEQLKSEVRKLGGDNYESFGIDNLPPDFAEQFLKRVIAFETAPMTTDFALLTTDGVALPEPQTVPDEESHAVLWRVIVALARHRVFLERTNHLSDRQLYSVLWHDVLREEHALLPDDATGGWHVHVPGDDENSTNYLTYYASDGERERWRAGCPASELPARRTPGYVRDATLPHAAD